MRREHAKRTCYTARLEQADDAGSDAGNRREETHPAPLCQHPESSVEHEVHVTSAGSNDPLDHSIRQVYVCFLPVAEACGKSTYDHPCEASCNSKGSGNSVV